MNELNVISTYVMINVYLIINYFSKFDNIYIYILIIKCDIFLNVISMCHDDEFIFNNKLYLIIYNNH